MSLDTAETMKEALQLDRILQSGTPEEVGRAKTQLQGILAASSYLTRIFYERDDAINLGISSGTYMFAKTPLDIHLGE